MVETAAAAANAWMLAEFEAKNLQALQELQELQELKTKYKVQVIEFPEEVIKGLKTLTKETLEEQAAKDQSFKRVYQAYKTFSDSNAAWNNISEAAYARALKL